MRATLVILLAVSSAGLLVAGYFAPSLAAFFAGAILLVLVLGPLTCLCGYGRWPGSLLSLNLALSALLLLLLVGEGGWRLLRPAVPEASAAAVYSYDEARGEPEAFRRWWLGYVGEWLRGRRIYSRPDPDGVLPGVLVPGARTNFFDGEIRINALGFRGPEIQPQKGDRYRIVALGTSTTFGATLGASDQTWPRKLERFIAERLHCAVSVEVVNAGGIAYRLHHNLVRLERDVLPLDPDLVISFHNHNGFRVVKSLQVPERGRSVTTPERGSLALGAVEAIVRRAFTRNSVSARRRDLADLDFDPVAFEAGLLDSELAADYRRLVAVARDHGVALVLCNHPLAVNGESPAEVVRFYESGFPDVHAAIVLNRMHTKLVAEIARREGVPLIDTLPTLDGAWRDAYVDLFHYTEAGRERLAERMFEGLAPILAAEPRLRCEPR